MMKMMKMKSKRYERNVRSRAGKEQGVALIATLLTVIVLSGLGIAALSLTMADTSNTARYGGDVRALYAAEAGTENVVKQLWADYVASDCTIGCVDPKAGGAPANLASYIAFLDGLGIPNDGTTWIALQNQPLSGQAAIQQVTVTRTDAGDGVTLAITSVGTGGTRQVTIGETIKVEGQLFKGLDYAMFAENVNCIMCHARFDSAERFYNTNGALKGTFDRIKVATLEDLSFRTDAADSIIAGTLYTSGTIRDKNGTLLTDLATTTLDGYQFDANGKIVESGAGNPTQVDLIKATGDPLSPLENLYVDYSSDPAGQVDGELPTNFPPPFPDSNGDRQVDSTEFATAEAKANGSVTGGILHGVPPGSSYGGGGGLPASSTADLSGGLNQTYSGNVILVGTDANPITCNGTIAVDGDVVINGKVKGECTIQAKGNIYVVGDTTYADGAQGINRTYGVAADGTKNTLGLVAGKNILVGDYLTTKNGIIDAGQQVGPPVWDPGNAQWKYDKASFTTSELTLFNKKQYEKAQADPSYTPRHYQLRHADPISRYVGTDEKGNTYDADFLAFTPNPTDAVITLSAAATGAGGVPWISESALKQIWDTDNANRAPGTPFQVDSLLYSNNAIFTLSRRSSNAQGQMVLNGALIAPDLGVLVPGHVIGQDALGNEINSVGLQLNYDQAVALLIKLKDNTVVTLGRRAWNLK